MILGERDVVWTQAKSLIVKYTIDIFISWDNSNISLHQTSIVALIHCCKNKVVFSKFEGENFMDENIYFRKKKTTKNSGPVYAY